MSAKPAGSRPERPVALVTGASGGLGQALAIELDALGCRVAVHYNSSEERARAVQDKLTHDSVVVGGDVGSYEAVTAMYGEIADRLGPVDVLVNNGAIRKDALMAMQSPADWADVIRTNLIGSFHTARVAVPHMLRQRWGRVINVVSPSGLIATAGQTAYSASKAGLIGFTRTLAAECGRRGVTVNALSPGFMITGMTQDLPDRVKEGMESKAPVPRFVTVEEVARSASLFLDQDCMTGQVISIDSGVSIT
ncbi:SDR family NAD(P)-dependent oxidoreductase [Streptomyces sp. WAC05374]|uniref:SDR family NAD(P)-dependent oxidoreductase n=1 Tax=Streptomyces sp. WAC05374 TaxID=2487420 RepID=UPI000F8752A8|nr:SDR family NAD(P)-dependent oxidoreductase [Streptomyces sp. WAC05374]RST15770.1 SDR family NAD(P)-dependent oxidoreductase [Streptomyces sp. WAC05374]TDF39082.1 SDR family NAD(P)-dependent oxidoreductase [Streptomyces sp. WAC05374]TDF47495.1 SDR family NAD(P)-dependent oxidoreductase [Streptomyces sp. WAC05374]TDF48190.1 SDR family NAD(P)-dependent oxidoreductase [Streptomyces sp. WAC05374]